MTTEIAIAFQITPVEAHATQVERDSGVAVITMVRRERFNALDAAAAKALMQQPAFVGALEAQLSRELESLTAAADGVGVAAGVAALSRSGRRDLAVWWRGDATASAGTTRRRNRPDCRPMMSVRLRTGIIGRPRLRGGIRRPPRRAQ